MIVSLSSRIFSAVYKKDSFSKDIILDATKEVAVAITSSTLTTVAVFLPIGLVSGAIGKLMLPMVLAVVYSILSSLIVALTVVPLMAFLLLKKTKHRKPSSSPRYVATLKWALSHKFIILLTAFFIICRINRSLYITTESKHKIGRRHNVIY